ncbi:MULTISPECIES: acyl-CoA synthetase [Methylorubrum]|jgi:fatty-acyl-CoA synthase|uniref:3-methylmercaptopropionyl-CoA ligase n=2 Tax=Methylorubrum extorquens TaxID=408 RepID=C5AQD1_METEA|nr:MULTISPECIES: acyl-CoA synthetase [Methylorubrum]ACS42191.1 putative AMP-dependent synthetase/acyl-CoA ligase [Methylorubrum extorquens AM1]EHP93208.1 o-succinylbenzoate--CoA ligase [Methylorubrum extorquens DSM 13060]MCP1544754.1 fatty-acyl-CoA synthase [Methylorubrum extorquens]MCP1587899.1 fatty-acyl-CoA synthase [Methylorubrum extorquens]BDL41582.1 acyl-CoA synthetase [Methylorubrum sp. GM97]
MARTTIYDRDLDPNPANFQPLTPLTYLDRAARTFPDRVAVIHGPLRRSYADLYARCRRLAAALAARGIGRGDTVAVLLANTPAMIECHYGVPMTGAVLNTLNTRLDAGALAFCLDHGEAKVFIVDREFARIGREALDKAGVSPLVIDYDDPEFTGDSAPVGETDYEDFLAAGDPDFGWAMPGDEWDAISLNYTSGTTGDPKGVVYHHRGAALLSLGNVITAGLPQHAVYLWTLPMFHCNGWCFPWTLSIVAGTHVCLRQVRAPAMYAALAEHGVTHLSGAPIVMSTLLNAPEAQKRPLPRRVHFLTAAAPPPEAVLAAMGEAGFDVTHLYGLTETYGPAVVNAWHEDWDALSRDEQARKKARQGVRYPVLEGLDVRDPETMESLPADGTSLGEVMFRGNVVMRGYLKNPASTEAAFKGGWFRSGDLGVKHPDGYIQLKDRSKDIIISGGENISSIEVEDALFKHPAVAAAAVVAKPDAKWGETPCAFIELKEGREATSEELVAWCRERLAPYKLPRHVVFGELPKTSTGKVQKFVLREKAREGDA